MTTAGKPRSKKKAAMSALSKSVGAGLKLAAQDARRTARMHGTPIYVVVDGKLVAQKP
jgi:hypothetical protein